MTLSFAGRVEAKVVVPTGGASVSASIGASSTATTVTIGAGSYYLTAAGGVGSLCSTLQQALCDQVQGYPATAAAMQAAVGYGAWSSGWLFNIASGNDTGAFGGVTMTAGSTPTYSNPGPRGGIDLAVGFDSGSDTFSAGNNYDVGATDDLLLAGVLKFSSVASTPDVCGKGYWGGTGYLILQNAGNLQFFVKDGVDTASCSVPISANVWYGYIAVLERATNQIRIGVAPLSTGVATVSTATSATLIGSCSNVANHTVGFTGNTTGDFILAAHYVGKGVGAATSVVANLSTAVQNFASAINDSWTVSLSTATGLITCSGSFWPRSVSWTNTSLRDVLGYAYDFDYPQTAAQMATALGYGTWTSGAGYLCNEASGNLASVFGTPATLTATSLTYSNLGARGGSDKAIGFDAGTDNADGGDVFDVTSTDDLIIAWVGAFSANPGGLRAFVTKYPGGTGGYLIQIDNTGTGSYYFAGYNQTPALDFQTAGASIQAKHRHVGIAVVDRSTGKARIGTYSLLDGTSSISAEVSAAAVSYANAGNLRIGQRADAGVSAATEQTLSAFYIVSGSGVATGLSASLGTALQNFATYMKSQTSTQQARGLWFPSCPISLVGDPSVAPRVTDKRDSMSPTGQMFSLVGNAYRKHQGVMWESVPQAQTWQAFAPYTNASFEEFANDCLYGLGHAWFKPGSPLQIYWDNAGTLRALGYTYNSSAGVPGWCIVNIRSTEPKRSYGAWTGYYRIEFGDVVSTE